MIKILKQFLVIHIQPICLKNISTHKMKLIKRYIERNKGQKCQQIVQSQQQLILNGKSSLLQMHDFYKSKNVIDFYLKNYGNIQMNLSNQLKIIQNIKSTFQLTDQEKHELSFEYSLIYARAMAVWILSDSDKLKQYLQKGQTLLISNSNHFPLHFQNLYLRAISHYLIRNTSKGLNILLEIINCQKYNQSQKQIALISILTIIGLKQKQIDQNKTKLFIKKIIKNNLNKSLSKIIPEDLENLNQQGAFNLWLTFKYHETPNWETIQIEPQFVNFIYLLIQNAYLKKQDIANTYRKLLPQQHPFQLFLKLSFMFDNQEYTQLIELVESKMKVFNEQPYWDRIYHNCLLLMKKSFQKLLEKNKSKQSEFQKKVQECQTLLLTFELSNNICLQSLPWYYFYIPFDQLFAWPIHQQDLLDMSQNNIKQQF